MSWKFILKTDEIEPFMELGDDHQQILADMIDRLVNEAIEEELSKRNSKNGKFVRRRISNATNKDIG